MTRLHPADIEAIAERVVALMGLSAPPKAPQIGDDVLAVIATQGAQAGVEFCKARMRSTQRRSSCR